MSSCSAVCVQCRVVVRAEGPRRCAQCREEMVQTSVRWRAPKKKDDKAWKLIASGTWNWDLQALAKADSVGALPTPLRRRSRAGRMGITRLQAYWESRSRGNQKSRIKDEVERRDTARRQRPARPA